MLIPVLVISFITSIIVLINFFCILITKTFITNNKLFKAIELWSVVFIPLLFLSIFDFNKINDCCTESATFSPAHRIGIYVIIAICILVYVASMYRQQIFAPLVELLVNVFLILGVIFNILLCFHLDTNDFGFSFIVLGNIPIILLFLIKLHQNQVLLSTHIDENEIAVDNLLGRLCLSILKLSPLQKYPILLFLLLPVLILFSLFLFLFGQQPDALIRAFTDTYKHGFSQLDYMCDNVDCGGHFLCSVGANGHRNIVKPIRYGERNGFKIICNRQLLISNAFEDLLQEKLPTIHKILRSNYNKVGHFVHRYYGIFNIKLVSDLVYIMMKPLELLFLLSLYTFDRKPENRIALQYLSRKDRHQII